MQLLPGFRRVPPVWIPITIDVRYDEGRQRAFGDGDGFEVNGAFYTAERLNHFENVLRVLDFLRTRSKMPRRLTRKAMIDASMSASEILLSGH